MALGRPNKTNNLRENPQGELLTKFEDIWTRNSWDNEVQKPNLTDGQTDQQSHLQSCRRQLKILGWSDMAHDHDVSLTLNGNHQKNILLQQFKYHN